MIGRANRQIKDGTMGMDEGESEEEKKNKYDVKTREGQEGGCKTRH